MSYQDLKLEVEFWLRRDPSDTQSSRFISLVEDEIDDAIRAENMEEVITVPGADSHILTLPETSSQDRVVIVGDGAPLIKQSISSVLNRRARGMAEGYPIYYARDGRSLYLDVSVATGTDVTIVQTKYFERLSGSVQTNWLLESNYNLYLSGALRWGYLFHKDMDASDIWTKTYDRALANFKRENKADKWAGQLVVRGR